MGDLWAITAYFNPAGYRRRLMNYRVFRPLLTVPLVAVELAHGPDFELEEGDADILIQLRGGDVMWQKERLLNIALRALPNDCRKVVWMDCDVVFGSKDWAERASRRLDEVALLQPFSRVHYLSRDRRSDDFGAADTESTRKSVAFTTASGVPAGIWLTPARDRRNPPGLGLAWAARRDLLDRHGFFDGCVVGGGDRAIVAAADGSGAALMDSQHMNAMQRKHYASWAEPFHAATGTVACYLDGDIFHLWHGRSRDRSYADRHLQLSRFDFDPFTDIAIADTGAWRWSSDKPDMHEYVRRYFVMRREDGD